MGILWLTIKKKFRRETKEPEIIEVLKNYLGYRRRKDDLPNGDIEGVIVTKQIKETGRSFVNMNLDIEPSRKVYNHSLDFEWGFSGSGAAQLALALLMDATGDNTLATALYQLFKSEIVASWQEDLWEISGEEILIWVKDAAGEADPLGDR